MNKPKLYVKKLWSTHPNLYMFIEYNKALKGYEFWCKKYSSAEGYSFKEWLDYEIYVQPVAGSKCPCCGGKFK